MSTFFITKQINFRSYLGHLTLYSTCELGNKTINRFFWKEFTIAVYGIIDGIMDHKAYIQLLKENLKPSAVS
jgi:hypothetical protein